MINKQDKEKLINLKIVKLNNFKNQISESLLEDPSEGRALMASERINELDRQIEALTNALKML
jgi:hypothetical protein